MTIYHTDAKMLKELFFKDGHSRIGDLETLHLDSINRLEARLLIARFEDNVILTDVGMEVAQKLGAL